MRKVLRSLGGENPTQRMEAFSDGVFAIAITLLILEIHTPDVGGARNSGLRSALLHLWPSYATYIFSFITVGIYWANHVYVSRLYAKSDHVFNLLNVLFLMCISFVPLPAMVLGEYVLDPAQRKSAVIFYDIGLLMPTIGWFSVWIYARTHRLLDPNLRPSFVETLTRQYLLSLVFYLGALLVAFLDPIVSLLISISQTAVYLLPPKRVLYLTSQEKRAGAAVL